MENPHVALLFYWDCCERQVRIEGTIEKIDPLISDDYFDARPIISQIGAWASEQSQQIPDRQSLEDRVAYFEFWQGRLGRLHDRICYQNNDKTWGNFRIAP